MRLNWKGHGQIIHGNYILRWWRHDLYSHYQILANTGTLLDFVTGKMHIKIILDKIVIDDISDYVPKLP